MGLYNHRQCVNSSSLKGSKRLFLSIGPQCVTIVIEEFGLISALLSMSSAITNTPIMKDISCS